MNRVLTTTSLQKSETHKEVEFDYFHIDMIPDAMRNMGWVMAPKLMCHWFSIDPAFEFDKNTKDKMLKGNPIELNASEINSSIVTMDWAKNYSQVKEGIKKLKLGWNTPNGRNVLKRRLMAKGDFSQECIFLGMENDVKELDAYAQVNFTLIGEKTDTINDWFGAMGNSNLKVCVKGSSGVLHSKSAFFVDKIGFYLKDTYDFLDENKFGYRIPEFLGVWSKKGILSKSDTLLFMSSYSAGLIGDLVRNFSGYCPVFNHDFRRWQKKHRTGGDYIILSDVFWTEPEDKDRVILL
ncbi:DUF6402 family protein [Pantoea sp. DY-17]|uniref:DUF6402 family protein n=1 Tax=Pantoea sp. DY-17 TaxID=2871490 RepID=UPI001C93A377|nr:DUF6402 family protein [Pantoea sp. DY-17]MBY4951461.1 DUF6402 family protein [Pantoea sp. DY-17]